MRTRTRTAHHTHIGHTCTRALTGDSLSSASARQRGTSARDLSFGSRWPQEILWSLLGRLGGVVPWHGLQACSWPHGVHIFQEIRISRWCCAYRDAVLANYCNIHVYYAAVFFTLWPRRDCAVCAPRRCRQGSARDPELPSVLRRSQTIARNLVVQLRLLRVCWALAQCCDKGDG